jgi:D-alanyl-D-alanine carboxypeptidase
VKGAKGFVTHLTSEIASWPGKIQDAITAMGAAIVAKIREVFSSILGRLGGGGADIPGGEAPGTMHGLTPGNFITGGGGGSLRAHQAAFGPLGGTAGLRTGFADRVNALRNAASAEGYNIGITSGFRTWGQQARLYAQKPGLAAPPGRSNHQLGLAADLNYHGSPAARAWAHRNAGRFGLRFPMRREPWHIEPSTPLPRKSFAPPPKPANDDNDKMINVNLDGHRVGQIALNAVARRSQWPTSAAGFDPRRSPSPPDLQYVG